MPVEIRELVIRATVNSKQSQVSDDAEAEPIPALTEADRSNIVRDAVEQVLRILKTSKER
jgi:hypothetical protein